MSDETDRMTATEAGWSRHRSEPSPDPLVNCDQESCDKQIHRGLAYACGDMHGEDPGCELYFCYDHLVFPDDEDYDGPFLCAACCRLWDAGSDPGGS